MRTKVAVIGYGHLGRWHAQKAEALNTLAEFIAIVDPTESSRAKAKEAHPNVKVVASVKEIINEIDAAVIVSPTSFHFELVKELLDANKHVFCEKPVTSTLEESKALEKILPTKQNLVLQVGHSERFHEAWERRAEYAEFFNKPAFIKLTRLGSFKGRATDVDVVADLMIHDIDLLLHLFGEFPTSLIATGYKMRTPKWDHVCAEFTFASGRRAHITVGRNFTEEVRSLEVVNEAGSLVVDLFRNKITVAKSNENAPEKFVESAEYPKRDHLILEQEAFYRSILEKRAPVVSLQDGIKALTLMDAVWKSLDQKKAISF